MKYILRDHGQLHRPVDGDVQGIDLMLAAWMLRLPHPLLTHDVNVHRVGRWVVDAEIEQRTPDKTNHEQGQGIIVPCAGTWMTANPAPGSSDPSVTNAGLPTGDCPSGCGSAKRGSASFPLTLTPGRHR